MKKSKQHFIFDIFFFGILLTLVFIICTINFFYNTYLSNSNLLFIKIINSFKIENFNSFLILIAMTVLIYCSLYYTVYCGVERNFISEDTQIKIIDIIQKILILIVLCLFPVLCLNELQFSFFTNIIAFYVILFSLVKKSN